MSRWAFRFLLFYIVILFTQPQNRFGFLHPFRIANLCALIAMGLHVLACQSEGRPLLRMGPATLLGFLLMGMGFASLHLGAYQDSSAWNPALDIIVKNSVIMILVEAMAYNVPRAWAVLATISISTLWWVKAGLRLGSAGVVYTQGRIMGPAVSMIENPNGFAYLMTATIPIYLYFYHSSKNVFVKWSFLACAVSGTYIVFNTGSRSGFLCLLMCGAMTLPKLLGKHKRVVILAGVAISLIWARTDPRNVERFRSIWEQAKYTLSGGGSEEEDFSHMTQDEQSAWERKQKNQDTWRLIKDHPLFGAGINPNPSLFIDSYHYASGQVHNELLMSGAHFGLPGMVLYLGFLGMLAKNGVQVFFRTRRWWPDVGEIGWMFLAQAAIIFVGGMFAPWPWSPYSMLLFGVASSLSGIVLAHPLAAPVGGTQPVRQPSGVGKMEGVGAS